MNTHFHALIYRKLRGSNIYCRREFKNKNKKKRKRKYKKQIKFYLFVALSM